MMNNYILDWMKLDNNLKKLFEIAPAQLNKIFEKSPKAIPIFHILQVFNYTSKLLKEACDDNEEKQIRKALLLIEKLIKLATGRKEKLKRQLRLAIRRNETYKEEFKRTLLLLEELAELTVTEHIESKNQIKIYSNNKKEITDERE